MSPCEKGPVVEPVEIVYVGRGGLGDLMNRYPYEGLVVTVGTLAVIIPFGMLLRYMSTQMPALGFFGICAIICAVLFLIALRLDKRRSAPPGAGERFGQPVLDLRPSDPGNSASPGKQELPAAPAASDNRQSGNR
jgi:hypothetical protein